MAFQPVIQTARSGLSLIEMDQKEQHLKEEQHVWDTAIAHMDSTFDICKKPKCVLKTVKVIVLFQEGMQMKYASVLNGNVDMVPVLNTMPIINKVPIMKKMNKADDGKNEKLKGKKDRTVAQKIVNKKLHTFAQGWVEKFKYLERKFLELRAIGEIPAKEFFPWNTNKSFMQAKNCIKTVYLQLVLLHHGGVIECKRTLNTEDYFFGIESFVILRDQRAVFDSCAVPSICSKSYPAKKGLAKLWSTCGFVETKDVLNGSLTYKYYAFERDKQRKNFAN